MRLKEREGEKARGREEGGREGGRGLVAWLNTLCLFLLCAGEAPKAD